MALFKKILVAIDGSENSKRALQTVIEMAADKEYKVTLMHVVQPVYQAVGGYGMIDMASLTSIQEGYGRDVLDESKEIMEKAHVQVDTQLVLGARGKQICELANSGEYDLIVIGRRGIGRLEEVVLGSVSSYVVRHSHIPVLIVQ